MKSLKQSTLCVGITFLFLLPISELAIRIQKGALLDFENTLYKPHFLQSNRFLAGYPEEYDPILGWVPQSQKNIRANWGGMVRTQQFGIRSNGRNSPNYPSYILALGGSFTFGDQVGDTETWPSYLEAMAGTTILNAGVSGYGFDQIILRLESLIEKKISPTKVIIAVTSQNIGLVSFSQRWGLNKPYFIIENNQLTLKNTPIQLTDKYPKLGWVRSVLGHSYAISVVLYRLTPAYWTAGLNYKFQSSPVNSDWRQISCSLTQRLSKSLKKYRIKGLIVFQYEKETGEYDFEVRDHLSSCARHANVAFFDTHPALLEIKKKLPKKFEDFFSWHMTRTGNAFIAEQIFQNIKNL